MIKRKHANELAALRRLALEDVLLASEADLREQAEEEGLDFNELAEKIRSSMREAAASVLREQLVKDRTPASTQRRASKCPSLERIKEAIREVFAREPELRVAFRDGRQQSQSDWESLYDDLVRLGALKPDERD
ncbi:hypothetical protein CKO44_00390 [Rubrivivax gelatinosus]|uniref:Uncharacterized protein n=1 Tax=Rubrivivax gelatinosus TaxID=28068 RepID=A0ABS1DPS1_RUBGE|nr:hypothetical protein [Rubrivivax gelatinosus]MBK1611928.1 hypothetical protein [Rubrivivax gelatinosus]MBK1711584.1 hypothetical protein [Rubrivivax gelatinosus]